MLLRPALKRVLFPRLDVSPNFVVQNGSASALTTYTFSNVRLKAGGGDGHVIVGVSGVNVTADRTISDFTIGGTKAVSLFQAAGTPGGQFHRQAFYGVQAPGSYGDIVVTWSAAQLRTHYAVWDVRNLQNLAATDSASDHDLTATLNCDVLAGGAIIAMSVTNSSGTITWGGSAVGVYDDTTLVATVRYAGAQYQSPTELADVPFSATISAGTAPASIAMALR